MTNSKFHTGERVTVLTREEVDNDVLLMVSDIWDSAEYGGQDFFVGKVIYLNMFNKTIYDLIPVIPGKPVSLVSEYLLRRKDKSLLVGDPFANIEVDQKAYTNFMFGE